MSSNSEEVEPILINEKQLSAMISIPVNTLQNWRVSGIGLPFIKMGPGRQAPVRYSVADVRAYIAKQRRHPSVRNEVEATIGAGKKR